MPDELIDKLEYRTAETHLHRARRSWRARFAADYRHWVRRTFSRESYVSSLKALLWVVPLSALIWSYAFNEQLVSTSVVNVHLTVSNDAERVIHFVSSPPYVVQVKFRGPQKDVAAVEEYLNAKPVKLDIDRNLGPGRHMIDIGAALNKDHEVSSHGMTVESYNPPEIMVNVDSFAERIVEVRLRPDEAASVQATFTPTTVKLIGPAQDLAAVEPKVAYAIIKRENGAFNMPGTLKLSAVALETPKGLGDSSTFSPSTVAASIEVTGAEESLTLAMSVLKAVPAGPAADDYKVTFDPRLTGVKIAGPKATIESIRNGAVDQPYADFVVEFSSPGVPRIATLRFPNLPPGVRVVQDEPRTIKYTVEDRKPNDH